MITLEQTTLSEKRYGALHSRVCLNICVNRGICQESGRKEEAIILFNADYVWRKEEVACGSVGHEQGRDTPGGTHLRSLGIWDVFSLQNTLDCVFDGLVL